METSDIEEQEEEITKQKRTHIENIYSEEMHAMFILNKTSRKTIRCPCVVLNKI